MSTEREKIKKRIDEMQRAYDQLAAEPDDVVTLDTVMKRVSDLDRHVLGRFSLAEKVLLNQLDEQLLGYIMIVGLFIFTSFYVFYFLVENMIRSRIPRIDSCDINLIVRAARFQVDKEVKELKELKETQELKEKQTLSVNVQ